jgi:7-carboxy-7-deazaguanine synthase
MLSKEINTQKVLPVMEHFYTIQGEGFHAGRAAYFIRLSGCDVGCIWCDVKESWEVSESQILSIDFLVAEIQKSGTDFVVFTGGEPAIYDLSFIVSLLKGQNIEVAIETSGTYPLLGDVDWYCFSPKKFKKPVEESYAKAHELKVIVYHESDFKWAEEHAQKVNAQCQLFLQPEWSKQDLFLPKIIAYVKENPRWKISLQTHKFMNIP